MANIDKHPAGTFCWVELATTNQNAAKTFYTSLFGWSVTDSPIGPDDLYSIFKIDGRDAAAGYTMRKEDRARGIPPHWMLYIAVENADRAVDKAAQAGGTILAPAFDVMEAGRMAVIQDPTGAIFAVWQSKNSTGIAVTGNNTLCWADLSTSEPDRAARFYSELFGWQFSKGENDSSGYLHIKNGSDFIGGMPPKNLRDPNAPPHWLIYYQAADTVAATQKAAQLGAKVLMPAQKMKHVGTLSILADPQGAVFALFTSGRQ